MGRLLLFNPGHDYALAHGGPFYIPPASIKKLEERLQNLPLIWAKEGDMILNAFDEIINLKCTPLSSLTGIYEEIEEIIPWGWDHAVKHRLKSLGFNERLFPDNEYLVNMRRLSHRRISIRCNEFLNSSHTPSEFFDISQAMEFAANNKGCYFKLPWSSGGRGVLSTTGLSEIQIKEWISGAIKKQGSVMAERLVDRKLDFASLWNVNGTDVIFEGFSVSLSDGRGKYKGNIYGSQKEILKYFNKNNFTVPGDTIGLQKNFLKLHVAQFYRGKVGIDMMVSNSNEIIPCVEINLRRTMGHVAMDYFNYLKCAGIPSFSTHLPLIDIKELYH